MANQGDMDFKQIVPRLGGVREAFEELCCQLAHRTVHKDVPFTRLHGAGGDGGVECFADPTDSNRLGWQAKYVFDIGSLLTQAEESLTTALKIHRTLTCYIICFPFDLTGPTGRSGLSGQEKFNKWRQEQEQNALAEGRQLAIVDWPAFKLRDLLLQYDASGGIREFFFNHKILTNEWFSAHLNLAKRTAGPRYTPELTVETDLWKWFAAFGRTAFWSQQFKDKMRACKKAYDQLASALHRSHHDQMSPAWHENSREEASSLAADILAQLSEFDRLAAADESAVHNDCVYRVDDLLSRLKYLESKLVNQLEAEHGPGMANSPNFRQVMAEYMVSFPAANLDYTRETIVAFSELQDWLRSPACSLGYQRAFVLTGAAGSGKTHGVCDAAIRRFNEGLLTCLTFGHEFRGEPDPWTRLLETLGLPVALGMNGLLDSLNAAGEASRLPIILCIDALNETRPLRYWRERLSTVFQAVRDRQYLRLCVTCRTSFLMYCLPEGHGFPIVEHGGFTGIERDACRAFFHYYELAPPIAPILQPELSNPLYLRLICDTMRSRGLHRMPSGWHGLAPTVRAFLHEKERQFAAEFETSEGGNIVGGCLMAIVREIANSGDSALSWSQAQRVISASKPQADKLPVLEWLIRADLLIEDAPAADASFGEESSVRPAFERLGDFLVAAELLERCKQTGLEGACQPGGLLQALFKDSDALEQNSGVLAALSILVPETHRGLEFPNFVEDGSIRSSLVRIAVRSFPSRDPATFSSASAALIQESLWQRDSSVDAMDMTLATSWQPSAIDGLWLDGLLKQKLLANRDAFWCAYLHDRFESHSTVHRLMIAAFELPLDQLEQEIAERWATVLLWVTAAADRRVKDGATRAATAILTALPAIIPSVLQRLLESDDDEVRERTLLSCYGALIVCRDADLIRRVTGMLQVSYRREPKGFDNALIRDHIRCIAELAHKLNDLPEGYDPELAMQPIASEWPLGLPSNEDIKGWDKLPKLAQSCLNDDFFVYSMDCLRPWEHAVPKMDLGKWILQRVARDFGYEGSGCEQYDRFMLGKHGGGRGKPTWAERIGKKYQWVAMYHLASRLHDHIERKQDEWEPKPLRTPLILLEERKLDPTLPPKVASGERHGGAWWITGSAALGATQTIPDEEWVARVGDLPTLENLLSVIQRDGQNWRILVSYPSWGHREEDANWNDPYRHVWMHIESFLVEEQDFDSAYECLHRRNFFGRWMPEGASWLYGFAGEYPWATPFNTEPEEWHGLGSHRGTLPIAYQPSWNHLAVEWEYDATILRNFHMIVPSRTFFSLGDLWWDGKDGYRLVKGRTVFRDSSATEPGPASLIVDVDDFLDRLNRLGLRLIWTLLGEKGILGGPHDKLTPRRTFSQVASLNEDGSVHAGEAVFFDDYDKDTGASSVHKKPKQRKNRN